jgi:radical SAM protein with 4Fe4S-binding SPASM domain
MMVTARCAPHFKRLAYEKDPESPITKAAGYTGGGCLAAFHYCRITPEGDVTPCPYIPTAVGNVKNESFVDIWNKADFFQNMRRPKLTGRCGDCEYEYICGGCRARAYAAKNDIMAEDPWCKYEPVKIGHKIKPQTTPPIPPLVRGGEGGVISWSPEAESRLEKVPYFLKGMVKKAVEGYAKEKGLNEITVALMEEVRKKSGRPSFTK